MAQDTNDADAARPSLDGRFLVLGAAVLWGTTGTAQALAPAGASPLAVGALRLAVGGAALVALALMRRDLTSTGRWPLAATVAAVAGMAVYQPLFFSGVDRTGVGVGTVVAIGTAPAISGFLAFVTRGERPARRWYPATVLALAGNALLVTARDEVAIEPLGVLLAAGAGSAYSVYAVAGKDLLDRHPPVAVAAVVFGAAGLMLSPLLVTADLSWVGTPRGAVVSLHLGLAATALAYILFSAGLARTPVATAVTLTLAEPLTAATLGIILLNESLGARGAAGTVLLIAGLVVIALPGRRVNRPPTRGPASPHR